jgi:ribosome biogenesis GTPase / thiamine phosphate phosphatase
MVAGYESFRTPVPMHAEEDVYSLSSLGFSPFFQDQLDPVGADRPARVAAEHRDIYELFSDRGVERGRLAGRLRRTAAAELRPGAGDWVTVHDQAGEGALVIDTVLRRRTLFTRGAAGQAGRVQVIASNVDLVFVVTGLDADFSIRRIERYVSRIWASGAQPLVVLNKADVCEDTEARIAAVEARCPAVSVLATSALQLQSLAPLRREIQDGVTAAFVGSSGAGKSTLINALLGEERMATGPLRERDGRGRHTTTHRQLFQLPEGGLLLDTPGMRELQIQGEEGLDAVFGEIATFARSCHFRDCHHESEPGCAVREAVRSGEISEDRLSHFHKLEREARAWERRQDDRVRRQDERKWGHMVNEVSRLTRKKSGFLD